MKRKLALFTAILVCLSSVAVAKVRVPDNYVVSPENAFAQHLQNLETTLEELTSEEALLKSGFVLCKECGGWYQNGTDFRNHVCDIDVDPDFSYDFDETYYDSVVDVLLNKDNKPQVKVIHVSTANGKSLNMRSGPSTRYSIITTIPNRSALNLYWYMDSEWAFVSYRNSFGFCMTRHLSISPGELVDMEETPDITKDLNELYKGFKPAGYYAAVNPTAPSGFVNLRWAPTKAAPVQCIYYAGEVLRVLSENGTWSQVLNETTGVSGFMMNSFLRKLVY